MDSIIFDKPKTETERAEDLNRGNLTRGASDIYCAMRQAVDAIPEFKKVSNVVTDEAIGDKMEQRNKIIELDSVPISQMRIISREIDGSPILDEDEKEIVVKPADVTARDFCLEALGRTKK